MPLAGFTTLFCSCFSFFWVLTVCHTGMSAGKSWESEQQQNGLLFVEQKLVSDSITWTSETSGQFVIYFKFLSCFLHGFCGFKSKTAARRVAVGLGRLQGCKIL